MIVRILGFVTLACGCLIGRYQDLRTNREIVYVENKGAGCQCNVHRRNHALSERIARIGSALRGATAR